MGEGGDLIKVGGSAEAGDALVCSTAQPMRLFGGAVPAILVRLGEPGLMCFLEFFTVNISNVNTRAAYARAARSFLRWCEGRGLAELKDVKPFHVAAYIEELGRTRTKRGKFFSKPGVKQHLACIRMLFDWLIVGQVVPSNPAAAVRGPKYSVAVGSTPVLSASEARTLLDSISGRDLVSLRDRALIGLMIYSFARVDAAVSMTVSDFYPERHRWWIRLDEKNGKVNKMPAHHNLALYLHEYIEAAGIKDDPNGPLFRSADWHTGLLNTVPLHRVNAWQMVQRRAKAAGIETRICNHTFRATGITVYLSNGGSVEKAQQMANHSDPRTTKLYDRRCDEVSLDEVERILV
jgi:integrase/recombinase XerD